LVSITLGLGLIVHPIFVWHADPAMVHGSILIRVVYKLADHVIGVFRAAASRLQRSQSKLEHLAQASRKEISTLLGQELRLRASDVPTEALEAERLLGVARLKAEKLLVDDEAGDLMSLLERYCDVLLEAKLPERLI
jgi:hypothetical protein